MRGLYLQGCASDLGRLEQRLFNPVSYHKSQTQSIQLNANPQVDDSPHINDLVVILFAFVKQAGWECSIVFELECFDTRPNCLNANLWQRIIRIIEIGPDRCIGVVYRLLPECQCGLESTFIGKSLHRYLASGAPENADFAIIERQYPDAGLITFLILNCGYLSELDSTINQLICFQERERATTVRYLLREEENRCEGGARRGPTSDGGEPLAETLCSIFSGTAGAARKQNRDPSQSNNSSTHYRQRAHRRFAARQPVLPSDHCRRPRLSTRGGSHGH